MEDGRIDREHPRGGLIDAAILLTGRKDDESYVKGMQLEAASYLTKPVVREELLEAIAAALRGANKKKANR
jgi:DNA-binding response OmpR family regulator